MTPTTSPHSHPAADDDALWRGVLDRSEDLDGRIFYAVSSTGIYCRPSCPSPRPRRGNVRFYLTPAAAERAGFRPCKRCHPKVHAEAAEGRLMAAELQVAAQIQQGLLPGRLELPEAWDLAFASRPCREIGGDHLDVFWRRRDGGLVLAVGDVSGKGAPAALLTACLHAGLRAQVEAQSDLPAALAELDSYLAATTPANRFASLFCAVLDPESGWLTYVNAGHPPGLLLAPDGTPHRLESGGPILGLVPGREFAARRVRLEPGAMLLLYSDGVSEAADPRGEELGVAPLESLLAASRGRSAAAVGERLEAVLAEHTAGGAAEDDRTWLALRRAGEASDAH